MVQRQQDMLRQDSGNVLAETRFLVTLLWVLLGAGLGIAATVVYLTANSIVPPIVEMVGAMGRLAGGDHAVEIPATEKHDEIGLMARDYSRSSRQISPGGGRKVRKGSIRPSRQRQEKVPVQNVTNGPVTPCPWVQ